MAASRGEVILFADDDVAPAMNWLEHISTPLLQRRCEAASGRVELGKELSRPWMTPQHLAWLAIFHGGLRQLIGANMGFHRSVLERVPEFDAELGAGASGFAEETLFSWQLLEAGFRLEYIPEAVVVHHPDPSRLIRSSWLSSARKHGASTAYLCHHWEHQEVRNPRMRAGCLQLKLRLRRMAQPPPPPDAEGIAAWEMSYAARLETLRQFLNERRRPRNYSKRGLRKLRPESNEQTCPSSAKVESAAGQRSIRADDPSFGTFQ
jgi:hypothetical protein